MKVKIVSDGTPEGTKVVNALTGEPILGIRKITWTVEVGALATGTLSIEVVGMRADIVGELEVREEEVGSEENP